MLSFHFVWPHWCCWVLLVHTYSGVRLAGKGQHYNWAVRLPTSLPACSDFAPEYFVYLHLLVSGDQTVREGHAIAHAVKAAIIAEKPAVYDVLVHIEPA